jgi:myo-inositol 2-dehydrogenase/D-chiro-inositol 1-dehydrogenase
MLAVNNLPESSLVKSDIGGVVAQKPMYFFLQRYADAYRLEFASLIEHLKSGKAISPGGEDGLQALRLADAALASMNSGQVVRL